MNIYKVEVNFNLRVNAKDRNDIEAIINKLNLPNQKIIKVIKMNSNCNWCGERLISSKGQNKKWCNSKCRSSFNNKKNKERKKISRYIKQNKEYRIEN